MEINNLKKAGRIKALIVKINGLKNKRDAILKNRLNKMKQEYETEFTNYFESEGFEVTKKNNALTASYKMVNISLERTKGKSIHFLLKIIEPYIQKYAVRLFASSSNKIHCPELDSEYFKKFISVEMDNEIKDLEKKLINAESEVDKAKNNQINFEVDDLSNMKKSFKSYPSFKDFLLGLFPK